MKSTAIVFEQPNDVAVRQIELPEPADDELLVRNTVTGVSVGTERWALIGKRPEMKYPNVPGYLGVGVVEQTGPGVEGFAAGDRVTYTSVRLPEPYGSNSWMGTHVSRAIVPTTIGDGWPPYVCKIDDAIDDTSAAMAGLASVAVQGADMVRITSNDIALVLGVGMIGQCAAQIFRARGARVVVADLLPDRIERALATGADDGIVLEDGPIAPQIIPDHLPETGADIVIDTTSVAPVVQQLAPLVKHRGQIVLQGYYPDLTPMDLHALHGRRPLIAVPCSMDLAGQEYSHRLLLTGLLKLNPLVNRRFTVDEAPEAYAMIADRPNDFLGVVFDWPNS